METFDLSFFSRPTEKIYINKSVYLNDLLHEHTHQFFEIVYVCKGAGIHTINGTSFPTKKGDIYFLGYKSIHTFKPTTSDFMWINCCFKPEVIDSALYDSQNPNDILTFAIFGNLFSHQKLSLSDIKLTNAISEFDTLFNEMYTEYSKSATGYQEVLKNYLNILLIKILRSSSMVYAKQKSGAQTDGDIVQLVLDFFNASSSFENVKLKDIAEKAFMSPKYFSNLFKKKTGKSLTSFLHEIKIDKACSLLVKTDMSIVEIMDYIGYKDTKFFYSIFKKQTGMTPGQYRVANKLKTKSDDDQEIKEKVKADS